MLVWSEQIYEPDKASVIISKCKGGGKGDVQG